MHKSQIPNPKSGHWLLVTGILLVIGLPASLPQAWQAGHWSLIISPVGADSLWKETTASPYTTQKALKAGDLITILVLESTTALHKAGTSTSFRDDLSLNLTHTIERLNPLISPSTKVTGKAENRYSGLGQTSRVSNIQAKIAATVIEVLPNGNLKIFGKHKVEVNEETQELAISGVVRPKDITLGNTVYSYQVANAEIAIKGRGAVGDGAAPGFLTRFLDWLF